ncbi:hypothetical protein CRYUN_Cryun02cG0020600 [Craigia yunnanensis]
MASFLSPSAAIYLQHKLNRTSFSAISPNTPSKISQTVLGNGRCQGLCFKIKAKGSVEGSVLEKESASISEKIDYGVIGVHHVGILCENFERSLEFYQNILGLEINEARPHDKLPYRGAWLWVGSEMFHLMELPNPDPLTGRPEHGGRDRHACIAIRDVSKLQAILDNAGKSFFLISTGIFAKQYLCIFICMVSICF